MIPIVLIDEGREHELALPVFLQPQKWSVDPGVRVPTCVPRDRQFQDTIASEDQSKKG